MYVMVLYLAKIIIVSKNGSPDEDEIVYNLQSTINVQFFFRISKENCAHEKPTKRIQSELTYHKYSILAGFGL